MGWDVSKVNVNGGVGNPSGSCRSFVAMRDANPSEVQSATRVILQTLKARNMARAFWSFLYIVLPPWTRPSRILFQILTVWIMMSFNINLHMCCCLDSKTSMFATVYSVDDESSGALTWTWIFRSFQESSHQENPELNGRLSFLEFQPFSGSKMAEAIAIGHPIGASGCRIAAPWWCQWWIQLGWVGPIRRTVIIYSKRRLKSSSRSLP